MIIPLQRFMEEGEESTMRSAPLKDGVNAAPQRALLKALGLCDDEIGRPLNGVVSSKNDIVSGTHEPRQDRGRAKQPDH